MATFLFDSTVFGPVISRRLGVSLGVNLLPNDSKLCSFDCIYCECGWNPDSKYVKAKLPTRDEVKLALENKLADMKSRNQMPDVITFAGNGEPTMHPHFEAIIDDTLALRQVYAPQSRVAVLSNSTMLFKPKVVEALKKVDDNILKLDSARIDTIKKMNKPVGKFDLNRVLEQLKQFEGELIIQTMFLKGEFNNEIIDNTTDEELSAWMKLIKEIAPQKVLIYTIARDTPVNSLEKVSIEKLNSIASALNEATGIKVEVSA